MVGLVSGTIAIGQFGAGFFKTAPPEPVVPTDVKPGPFTKSNKERLSPDETRLMTLLSNNVSCDGLTLELLSLARKDTPKEESTSGHAGTYLETTLQARHEGTGKLIEAVATGRGPGGEGQAFLRLSEAVQVQINETYSECSKG